MFGHKVEFVHNGIKAAIIVEVAVLVGAALISIICLAIDMPRTTTGVTIALVAALVLVTGLLLVIFYGRLLQRNELVRRVYVSGQGLFNHEVGLVPTAQVTESEGVEGLVSFVANTIASLDYKFEMAEVPESYEPSFLISTRTFSYHRANGKVVVDDWHGALQGVGSVGADGKRPKVTLGTYESRQELVDLLVTSNVLSK